MDNNCHIPDLVKAFFKEEKGGFNLVLKLAKPTTCMTVPYKSITFTTIREQNKETYWVKMSKKKRSSVVNIVL